MNPRVQDAIARNGPVQRMYTTVLPSGSQVDLRRIDVTSVKDLRDACYLAQILNVKALKIVSQLDHWERGEHADGTKFSASNPPKANWDLRATRSLAWTRVQIKTVETWIGHLVATEVHAVEFVSAARSVLPTDVFEEINERARQTSGATA